MALYISREGQKITGYGKTGETLIAFWPQIDGQPARKNEVYWDGSQVQLKSTQMLVDDYAEEKLLELRELFYTRWVDSGKTGAANQAQYNNAKSTMQGATSISEVDTAYSDFEAFMDLS